MPEVQKENQRKRRKVLPFCGADIRTEAEITVEKLEKSKEIYRFIPETYRDDFLATMSAAIRLLKER